MVAYTAGIAGSFGYHNNDTITQLPIICFVSVSICFSRELNRLQSVSLGNNIR
jgi:hypothetical protein